MTRRTAIACGVAATIHASKGDTKADAGGRIRLSRVPNGGIQPQALVDSRGVVHLLYYSGNPFNGNVFYARSGDHGQSFSEPLQVNNSGSAIAAGTIRGAQMAVGKDGLVHVAWNGSSAAKLQGPVNPDSGKPGAPMLYSRLNDAGTAFEPERNLMHRSFGLDGGGSVAADMSGNVYVAWHGIPVDLKSGAGAEGEARRQVWISKSVDNGRTFASERVAWKEHTGACGCCGMKAFASREGAVYMLYRSATQAVHRDIYLLSSKDHGSSFQGELLHKWDINACPMSSMDFAEGQKRMVAAWQTGGEVFWKEITGDDGAQPTSAPAGKGQKHPRLVLNGAGEMLFVWTEGTGWQKGGSLAYQLYDPAGKSMSDKGTNSGIPAWSFAAPVPNPDGSFTIFY